ncbi:type VI secretion system contractile sheath small subunit [Pseudoduganella ginsengisoli]|uniref:Type VI secretion system contractile sheath small subunit n=1 Tax=Pseudoduganella ginsengisoli TaxID=1462440 RepID=A0A6L6PX21_9BURK|nr:type VI secretion system contractile sheath small subunit [Pseudoduganella ginsengisoli]MTW02107.1 type VI secretion system contractile sheath small subunit [Pseudoduganella ginsengisoli]
MANSDSIQKRLGKVRAPRVQMSYDVEIGDAMESKELPFVIGVIGDFGGNPAQPLKRLKERRFIGIDADNFDEVLAGVAPHARFEAPNRLGGEGAIPVELAFRAMSDFRPEAVVQQVEPLRQLLEARGKLADLRNKLAGNDKLEDLLAQVLADTEQIRDGLRGQAHDSGEA